MLTARIAVLSLLAASVLAAAPPKGPRLRVQPAQAVTVKLMPPAHFATRAPAGTAYIITTVDADSCTVWLPTPQSGRNLRAELAAYSACWRAMAKENGCDEKGGHGCD